MRLALVTNDYPPRPGGIQQYLGNLVDAHPGDVRVLAPRDAAATIRRGDAVVRRDRRRFMWPTRRTTDWVVSELADFRPDGVLFGAPHPLARMGPDLRRRLDVPFGVLGHGAELTIPAAVPGVRSFLARTLAAADVRFAVSRYTAGRIEALCGLPAHHLGAGVDVDLFVPAADIATSGPPVVGCVSRFVPRKGQHRLVEAVARVRARGADCELLLVGRGRTERRLRRLVAKRRVPTRFVVDAPWGDLPGLYASMDVFCMPCRSRWLGLEVEGLGLVFLEAAAAGLPVLAGDSGGSAETVVPGVTGYVVARLDDVVAGLELLLADPVRRRDMGRAGRRRVETEFTWAAVANRLISGFASVS